MTVDEVKRDLRLLRKINRKVDYLLEVEARQKSYLESLRREKPSAENEKAIARVEYIISTLDVSKRVAQAAEISEKYMAAICKLSPLDRRIILDGFINHREYWKIGQDIGYSEIWVQKRVNTAIEQLVKILQSV